MAEQIRRVLRWACLLLVGVIGWQVYGVVTAPEPFDRLGEFALADPDLRTAPSEVEGEQAAVPSPEGAAAERESAGPGASGQSDSEKAVPAKAGPGGKEGEASKEGGAAKQTGESKKAETGTSPPFPAEFEVIATSGVLGKAPEKKPSPPTLLGLLGKYALIRAPNGKEDLVAEGGDLGGVKVVRISTNRVLIEYEGRQMELTVYSGFGSSPLLEKPTGAPEKPAGASQPEAKPEKPAGPSQPDTTTDQPAGPSEPEAKSEKPAGPSTPEAETAKPAGPSTTGAKTGKDADLSEPAATTEQPTGATKPATSPTNAERNN